MMSAIYLRSKIFDMSKTQIA